MDKRTEKKEGRKEQTLSGQLVAHSSLISYSHGTQPSGRFRYIYLICPLRGKSCKHGTMYIKKLFKPIIIVSIIRDHNHLLKKHQHQDCSKARKMWRNAGCMAKKVKELLAVERIDDPLYILDFPFQ